jgi:hypothetical protein
MYDMHNVFSIVVPEEETLKHDVYNLYMDYASVTPAMVAKSNIWYNTWPSAPTWSENLGLDRPVLQEQCCARLD